MRAFSLLSCQKRNPFSNHPVGCGCFCCLLIFGALVGRALFVGFYEEAAHTLLANLSERARPHDRPLLLLYALLPPAAYCAAVYLSGFSRALLPLWGAAVLLLGGALGMRLGAASALIAKDRTWLAWLTLLAPMLALLPLHADIALLALQHQKREEHVGRDRRLEQWMRAVPPAAALIGLNTLIVTFSYLYSLKNLFD